MVLYHMQKEEFKTIRKKLGKTQKELSKVLNISAKTVESYEQGLRNIPLNIQRIIYFIYLRTKLPLTKDFKKCWQVHKCPFKIKKDCLAWLTKEGFYCWFFTGKTCSWKAKLSDNKTKTCFECDFFQDQYKLIK